jgi:hypothetical protein
LLKRNNTDVLSPFHLLPLFNAALGNIRIFRISLSFLEEMLGFAQQAHLDISQTSMGVQSPSKIPFPNGKTQGHFCAQFLDSGKCISGFSFPLTDVKVTVPRRYVIAVVQRGRKPALGVVSIPPAGFYVESAMRNAEELPAPRGSAPEDPAKGADYRSPHHIELRYDGMLSTRAGMSDPEALRQLALPNPLFAQHHARSARSRKRFIIVLVWLALASVGLFIWNGLRETTVDTHAKARQAMAPALSQPHAVVPSAVHRATLAATDRIASVHDAPEAADAAPSADITPPSTERETSAMRDVNGARIGGAPPGQAGACDDVVSALGLCQGEQRQAASALGMLPRPGKPSP